MTNRRGFTLVELIVVIVVIAILATVATLGLNRYLQDGRDSQRASNITTVAEALEKYFDRNGEYPSCSQISAAGPTVATNTLKGIDESALLVPSPAAGATNSIRCTGTLAVTGEDFIQYVGDGSATCTSGTSCLSYKLRYRSESSNTILELESRRTASLSSSGAIRNLAAAPVCYTRINLTWAAVPNAASYTIERADNESFSSGLQSSSTTTNSAAFTGLSGGQEKFFRVRPIGVSQNGDWSNVASATTVSLGTPTLSTTVNSTTQITSNWTVPSNSGCGGAATTYTLQRATNTAFTTGLVSFPGLTSTSHASTGLTVGQSYYFRVQAVTTGDTSNWSNVRATSTVPNPPTNVSATINSATQATVSWTASSGATSYTIKYGTTSAANSYSTTTTNTSLAIGGLSQGTTWYFQVFAVNSGVESTGSSVVNGTTPINQPGGYSISAWVDQGQSLYATANSSCPAGTSYMYHWYANGGFWVGGGQHRTVGYWLNWGQSVTLQVASRCEKNGIVSEWTWANNSVGHSRPGMNFGMSLGPDGCSYGYCGRTVYAGWNNVCGSGAPRIYSRQMSAYGNWIADSPSNDEIKWKGASGAGVWVDYYDVNIGCTAAAGSIQVPSAYRCNGCS